MWQTPKTDWYGKTDGTYVGDRFDYEDFNRIKNNLEYLKDIGNVIYPEFDIEDAGVDREPIEYVYADEMNLLERNLTTVNENTVGLDIGTPREYKDDEAVANYTELNRLETYTLRLYDNITNGANGRRKLEFAFGRRRY